MHIGKKILDDIENDDIYNSLLKKEYSIYIDKSLWDSFRNPLPTTGIFNKKIDKTKFKIRQENAKNIIREILNTHGKSDIGEFLGYLATVEPNIQELQPRVRDHVVHAVNTFILGVYIIKNTNLQPSTGLSDDYKFMWKLCGPTHDLGYPIEIAYNITSPVLKKLNDTLDEINSPSQKVNQKPYAQAQNLDKLCDDIDANKIIQNRLKDWELDIDIEDYYGWLIKNNRTDHGVVSALIQLKMIDALYYKENPQKEYRDIINPAGLNFNQNNFDSDIVSASSAVFIHNIDIEYPGFSKKINFNIAPLAFLLFLCDTFQEWDRYSEKRVYSGYKFDININSTDKSISLSVPPGEVEDKISLAMEKRLSGLRVNVNGKVVVS